MLAMPMAYHGTLLRLSRQLLLRLGLALLFVAGLATAVSAHHTQWPTRPALRTATVDAQWTEPSCNRVLGDLPVTHPQFAAIQLLVGKCVIHGYPDNTFRPDERITRAEFAKLLVMALDLKPRPELPLDFADATGHWAAEMGYLQTAVSINAIEGFLDGSFGPDVAVTRAEAVKMVAAALGYDVDVLGELPSPYPDLDPEDWFYGWVISAYRAGVVGSGGSAGTFPVLGGGVFAGNLAATRAEAAAIVANLYQMHIAWRASDSHWGGNLGRVPYADYVRGVNVAFGNFTFTETDARTESGRGLPVRMQRTYNAFDPGKASFGNGWTWGYDIRLIMDGRDITVVFPSGRRVLFREDGTGGYRGGPGVLETLREEEGRLTLTDRDHVKFEFGSSGLVRRLTAIVDRNENAILFTYEPDGITISDAQNRVFHLILRDGRITTVKDPAGYVWRYEYEDDGDLRAVTNPRGGVTRYVYDSDHRLTASAGPRQVPGHEEAAALEPVLTLEYDGQGRVKRQRDGDGGTTHYAYFPLSQETAVKDGAGQITWWKYDARLRVTERADPRGYKETYKYNDDNLLTDLTDRAGRKARKEYDRRGNLSKETRFVETQFEATTTWKPHAVFNVPEAVIDGLEHTTELGYDGKGNLLLRIDPPDDSGDTSTKDQRTTRFAVHTNGMLKSVTDPLGHSTSYKYAFYDDGSYEETATNALRQKATIRYDPLGRKVQESDRLGYSTFYRYEYLADGERQVVTGPDGTAISHFDQAGNLASFTDPRGRTTTFAYNRRNLLTTVKDPEGNTVEYEYDGAGRRTQLTNSRDGRTVYDYDDAGWLEAETVTLFAARDPLTGEERPHTATTWYERRPDGSLGKVTDPVGRQTRYEYDAAGRVAAVRKHGLVAYGKPERELIEEARFTYDRLGRKRTEQDGTGVTRSFEYDAAGRLRSMTDGDGHATRFGYDKAGNRVSEQRPGGAATTHDYDSLGRLKRVTRPLGQVTEHDYQLTTLNGQAVEEETRTDGEGFSHRLYFGSGGKIVQVKNPNGEVTGYQYYPDGTLKATTSGLRATWTFDYEFRGLLTFEKDPLGYETTHHYDAAGNRDLTTYADGTTVTFDHDLANRMTATVTNDGSEIRNEYDAAGYRTAMADGTGTTRWWYDGAGRMAWQEVPGGRTLSKTYDLAGRVRSVTGYDGATTGYQFDNVGRLEEVTPSEGGAIQLKYDPDGHRQGVQYPNGVTATYRYDAARRLESLTWERERDGLQPEALQQFSYSYDKRGLVTGRTDARGETQYRYDPAGQLTDEIRQDQSVHYQYDAAGNRVLRQVRRGGLDVETTRYTYDAANRVITAGGRTFTWDKRGNQLSDGATWYQYDGLNRLTGVIPASGPQISYSYNGDGQQVQRSVPGGEIRRYAWHQDHMVLETDEAGRTMGQTLFVGGLPLRRVSGTAEAYYLFDGHGDVRQLLDPTGEKLARYDYDAFGLPEVEAGTISNPFRYAGEQWDPGARLYNLRARQYAPALGRFLTQDAFRGTARSPSTQHLYMYAYNNPVNLIDPTGLFPFCQFCFDDGGGGGGGGFGLALYYWVSSNSADIAETAIDTADLAKNPSWPGAAAVGMDALALLAPEGQARNDGPTSTANVKDGLAAARRGNQLHYDEQNGGTGQALPTQLQEMFPDTEFRFARRGQSGPDVRYQRGTHPSEYPDSSWTSSSNFGDFKPNTESGRKSFERDVRKGKLPPGTQMIPHNPDSGMTEW